MKIVLGEILYLYMYYCKFQKVLNDKMTKAYRTDLEQFVACIGKNDGNLNK